MEGDEKAMLTYCKQNVQRIKGAVKVMCIERDNFAALLKPKNINLKLFYEENFTSNSVRSVG
jgi:hypothetical protein